ncbi:MAG: sugar ABC transporter substrate-binding protein [Firmicutes bacterium]|nr:sugar ABC transporter substrate-binding protein [Bacillota bacterium]
MQRKLISTLLIAVLGLMSLSVVAQAKTKITYWTWWNFDEGIKQFEKSHPDIEVEVVQMGPWDLHDKLLVSLAAGTGAPDVVQLVIRRFDAYMSTGKLVDLSPYVNDLKDNYAPAQWNLTQYDGKTWGLPTDVGPAVVFYRKDIFEECGIEVPLKTWDDFVAAGKKIADGNRYMLPVFAPSGQWGVANFFMYLQSRGGNIYTADGELIKDNPLLRETLEWYYGLVKDQIGYPVPFFTPQFWAAFQSGKLATYPIHIPEGMANLPKFVPDLSGKWDVMPWPRWAPDAPALTGNWGGNVLAVPTQSKKQEAAIEFVKWMSGSTEGQLAIYNILGGWPTYEPTLEEPDLSGSNPYFSDAVLSEYLLPYPDFWFFDEARTTQIIGKELDNLFAGEINVDQAYENIIAEISRELNR